MRGAGELLGELAVLDSQPRSASVIAAETCVVHIVPAADFLAFVDKYDLLAPLLRHAIARVREAESVRLELATASVPARLASALTRLADLSSATARELSVRLTQTELSQMIGASRNAVGTALRPWREHGWLDTTPGGGLSCATSRPSDGTSAPKRDAQHHSDAHSWAPPAEGLNQHGTCCDRHD